MLVIGGGVKIETIVVQWAREAIYRTFQVEVEVLNKQSFLCGIFLNLLSVCSSISTGEVTFTLHLGSSIVMLSVGKSSYARSMTK
ncbi:hypothetical protein J6590_040972 [Homalodisca vitripennis]|nr:hypothetical protein J6590_040972 [Homalodisca vitripennis]